MRSSNHHRGGRVAAVVILGSIAALAMVAAAILWGGAAPARKLNVIVLVMDTTRADRCSFLGYPRETTPNLAALARESTSFRQTWSSASWTLPAHSSLFTGLRMERHGCGREGQARLDGAQPTLAEILRDAGYATGSFSSNPFVSSEFGLGRGFEHEYRVERLGRPDPAASVIHASALAWIAEQTAVGKPFFAFLNNMEPHSPYDPPSDVSARFRRGPIDDPAAGEPSLRRLPARLGRSKLPAPRLERLGDLYDAEIADLDRHIGAFVAELRSRGLLDNTLLVILGDHGEGLGDHDWIEHSTVLYQEVIHVPLLMRLPGRFGDGRAVDDIVQLEDMLPTITDVLGLPLPTARDGTPLDGQVIDHRSGDGKRAFAFATEGAHPDWIERVNRITPGSDISLLRTARRSVTDGRWHLIVDDNGTVELFDLSTDPREQRNVATTEVAELARLRAALDAHR